MAPFLATLILGDMYWLCSFVLCRGASLHLGTWSLKSIQNYFAFFGEEDERHDPKEVIEAMVSIVPADTGFFRNVVPKAFEEFIKTDQKGAWENQI